MRWYMSAEPVAERLPEQPRVETGDNECHEIREDLEPRRVHELAHLHAVGREHHERKDGERELKTEHDLARHQEPRGPTFPVQDGDDSSRHNGNRPCDEPPEPGPDTNIEESLHDDLAGERPCQG